MSWRIFEYDPYLLPYEADIDRRMENYSRKRRELLGDGNDRSLYDLADGHEYFGFHRTVTAGCTANGHLPRRICT